MQTTIIIPQSHANFARLLPGHSLALNRTIFKVEDDITKLPSRFNISNKYSERGSTNVNLNMYADNSTKTKSSTLPRGSDSVYTRFESPAAFKSATLPAYTRSEMHKITNESKRFVRNNQLLSRVAQQMHDIISDLKHITLKREKRYKIQDTEQAKSTSKKKNRVENEYDMNLIPQRMGLHTKKLVNQTSDASCVKSPCRKYESSFNPQTYIISDNSYVITPDKLRKVALDTHEKRLSGVKNSALNQRLSLSKQISPKHITSPLTKHIESGPNDTCDAQTLANHRRSFEQRRRRQRQLFPHEYQETEITKHDSNNSSGSITGHRWNIFQRQNGSLVRRNSSVLPSRKRSNSYRTNYVDDEHIYDTIAGDESLNCILWNGHTPLYTQKTPSARAVSTGECTQTQASDFESRESNEHRVYSPPLPKRIERTGLKTYHSMETLNRKSTRKPHHEESFILDSLHIDHYEIIKTPPFLQHFKFRFPERDERRRSSHNVRQCESSNKNEIPARSKTSSDINEARNQERLRNLTHTIFKRKSVSTPIPRFRRDSTSPDSIHDVSRQKPSFVPKVSTNRTRSLPVPSYV